MTRLVPRREMLRLGAGGALALAGCSRSSNKTVVGSKNFTEQIVLAELVAAQIQAHTGLRVAKKLNLGGTLICQQALLAGQMDVYVEYTGTALAAVLHEPLAGTPAEVFQKVRDEYRDHFHLSAGPLLGFNNTFAIVVRGEDAERYRLKTISDIVPVAQKWRAGFGYEFMERSDGYKGLSQAYGLSFGAQPRIMDLGLLYRALREKQVDVVAGNSTDGLILALGMTALEDDRHFFPPYQAVPVVRTAALDSHPELATALNALGGKITDEQMRQMNYAVDGRQQDAAAVARDFLRLQNL